MNNKYIYILLLFSTLFYSCNQNKKRSTGIIDDENLRQGYWEIRNNEQKIASGEYLNGLKKGKWRYIKMNYNNTNIVDWGIHIDTWGMLNIPNDWKLESTQSAPIIATYGTLSFNLIIINSEGKDLENLVKEVEVLNRGNENYMLFEKQPLLINGYSGYVLRQRILLENGINFSEQYLILKEKKQEMFLLSFYNSKGFSEESNKVFSEIAFSTQFIP